MLEEKDIPIDEEPTESFNRDNPFAGLEAFLDRPIPASPDKDVAKLVVDERYPQLLLNYIVTGARVRLRPMKITGYRAIRPLYYNSKE